MTTAARGCLAAALLLATVTGCRAADQTDAPPGTTESVTRASASAAAPSAPPAHPEKLTTAEGRRLLLGAGDVPQWWVRDRDADDEIRAQRASGTLQAPSGCASLEAYRKKVRPIRALFSGGRAFTYEPDRGVADQRSGVLRVRITQFKDETDAKLHLGTVRAQAACPRLTANASLGSLRVTPVKVAPLGHEAVAWALQPDEAGYTAVEMRVVRVGTVAVQVESAGGLPSVPTVASQALQTQVAAVSKALAAHRPTGAPVSTTR